MIWSRRPIDARSRRPGGRRSQSGSCSVVDGFFDSWVHWREACEDVRSAYERWGAAKGAQRALAFESYRAALEREAQAAVVYASSSDRLNAGEL